MLAARPILLLVIATASWPAHPEQPAPAAPSASPVDPGLELRYRYEGVDQDGIASDADANTLRIRAKIEGFNRERYQIGPKRTDGWLARVQELAPVVATDGTIEVNLFATEPATQ